MTESDPLYCFVDANILIHFQTFDEVDWADKLQSRHVRLMLAPAVMREIDKFKDDNSNERRRKRVRTILAKLRDLLEHSGDVEIASVREGTSLAVIDLEPQVDWAHYHLDPIIEDDRLLASILEFRREHDQIDVVLVTNDFPLLRKARRHGIPCRDPEGLLARHELPSPEEELVRNLQRELAEIHSRIPRVRLGFWEEGAVAQTIKRPLRSAKPNRPTDRQFSRYVERLRQQFEQEAGSAPNGRFRRENVKDFVEEYEHYLVNARVLLEKRRAREFDWRYEVAFVLENTGTAAAQDVEVILEFPPGSFAVGLEDEHDDYDGIGELKLSRPVPEWKQSRELWLIGVVQKHEPWSVSYPEHHEREAVPTGPLYYNDRSRISYQHPKLRPQDRWEMPAVAVYVPPLAGGGFSIRYVIQADQFVRPIEGQLHVRLEAGSQVKS